MGITSRPVTIAVYHIFIEKNCSLRGLEIDLRGLHGDFLGRQERLYTAVVVVHYIIFFQYWYHCDSTVSTLSVSMSSRPKKLQSFHYFSSFELPLQIYFVNYCFKINSQWIAILLHSIEIECYYLSMDVTVFCQM